MKILIVSYVYPNKDDPRLGLFVHEQAKELVNQGHKVYVLTSGSSADKKEDVDGAIIYRLGTPKILSGMFFNFRAFIRILSLKDDIDVIHLHFIGLSSFFCGIVSKIVKAPLVATAHGIDVCPTNALHKLLIRFYLLFPKKIMAVSKFTYELAAANTDKKKLIVVNNGVDLRKLKVIEKADAFKSRQGLKNKKIILSVGGLVERKGQDTVIKALPDVIKEAPNLVYLIIGKGSEEKNLKALVNSLNLQNNVKFLGYVNNKDIVNYFNVCDIFVLMSRTIKEKGGIEGFGIVFIEASALGKPVIGGKSGGTGDAIVDGVTGFRIEPDNVEELKSRLILLLKDEKLRKKMGNEGRKIVLKKFLWKHNVEKTVNVYEDVIINRKYYS